MKKVFANRRKNVDQDHLFVEHRCTVPEIGRKMQYGTSVKNLLFVAYGKQNTTLLDDGHLFMRMLMGWRDRVGSKPQAADHQAFANDHLPLYALTDLFKRNGFPVVLLT